MSNMRVTVQVDLADSVLRHVLAVSLAMGVSVNEYFAIALMSGGAQNTELKKTADPADWIQLALDRARAKVSHHEFTLRSLFSAEEWRKLPSHQVFGRVFRKEIEKAGIGHFHARSPTNQAIYLRH